jgi:hypothetical protein
MSSKSSVNCAGCNKLLNKKERMRCSACEAIYDLDCANISSKRFLSFYAAGSKRNWSCPECISKQPKKGNLDTPVRHPTNNESDDDGNTAKNVTQRSKNSRACAVDSSNESCDEQVSDMKLLVSEIRAMRLEMSRLHTTIIGLTDEIKAQNTRINTLEAKVDALEARMDTDTSEKRNIEELEDDIMRLKLDIQDRDQEILANDVEISGFPETSNESTVHILLTVAKKLGVALEERDIVNVERAGPVRAFIEGEAPPRPRPLVARLTRRSARDAMLQAARVRRGLTTEGMALSGGNRTFYINERLTRCNRQLFQKTRVAAKIKNWKFVWTRQGKIFTRREHGSVVHRLRFETDIERVFGGHTVSAAVNV